MQLYRLSIQKEFCIFEVLPAYAMHNMHLLNFTSLLYLGFTIACLSVHHWLIDAVETPTQYLLIKLMYNTTVVMQVASPGNS